MAEFPTLNGGEDPHAGAGEIDRQWALVVRYINEMLAEPPAPGVDPMAAARTAASAVFRNLAGPSEHDELLTCDDRTVDGADGAVSARVYRRADRPTGGAPGVVFFHGGGWRLGGLDDYDALLRPLAALSGAVIVSVDYRLAPEHPFPSGLNDAMAATDFIARNANEFGIDPARLGVMGDSAGGNFAAVVAQASRTSGPAIAAQFLLYAVLDVSRPHTAYLSRMRYGDGAHFLTREAVDASLASYLPDLALAPDPRVSPLNEPDLKGSPPAFILTPGCDPLRDESAAYARKLKAAGADVRYRCVPGAIHAFLSFGVIERARAARRMLAAEIRNMLSTSA
ncbi:MAG TPA: alpha/beta hydrolase [Parvularculaceae bacterium]|nr:alpha/beta hydrolase [Parvularculaceae bacterium]